MVGETPYGDAEGEIVRAARDLLGADLPMVATYDFHSLMSKWENENCVPFPNNTNPHIDGYERGLEAAVSLLAIEGRLTVISYHSLEDRIIKSFFNKEKH